MSRAEDFSDNFLFKAGPLDAGYNRIISRGEKGLKHLEFGMLSLESGGWSGETGDCETALDIHRGVVSISTPDSAWECIGGRMSVFDGSPAAVYLPPGTDYRIEVADGPAEIAVFSALAPASAGEARAYRSGDVPGSPVGSGCTERQAWGILEKDAPASRLILGEVLLPPGRWGSAHKHDAFNPPHEAPYEEVCYCRVSPPHGFGVVRIWTGPNDPGPMDEVYVIEDGDTVVIPRGYHIIGAAPGSTIHCTYALAGDFRIPGAVSLDPAFGGAQGA